MKKKGTFLKDLFNSEVVKGAFVVLGAVGGAATEVASGQLPTFMGMMGGASVAASLVYMGEKLAERKVAPKRRELEKEQYAHWLCKSGRKQGEKFEFQDFELSLA